MDNGIYIYTHNIYIYMDYIGFTMGYMMDNDG